MGEFYSEEDSAAAEAVLGAEGAVLVAVVLEEGVLEAEGPDGKL